MKRILSVVFFLTIAQFIFHLPRVIAQEIPLDPQYCGGPNNDYYLIPGEPIYDGKPCSRAPEACGNSYDDVNTSSIMPNPQSCMGDGDGRQQKGCAGYVPVCCYEVARTGDFTKCVGYWERLWCAQSQCDAARGRGASDEQCGGSCQCGHAFNSYCGSSTQPVPLSQRIAGITAEPNPTATPTTPIGVTPTLTIQPSTITSVQSTVTPTTSAVSCDTQKKQGNFNCAGGVDEADFTAWKESFSAKTSTLSFFEYWRRSIYQ